MIEFGVTAGQLDRSAEDKQRLRRSMKAASAGAVLSFGLIAGTTATVHSVTAPDCKPSDESKNVVASAAYDFDDTHVQLLGVEVPTESTDKRMAIIHDAFTEPIAQLAIKKGDVAHVIVNLSHADDSYNIHKEVPENSFFVNNPACGVEKEILLDLTVDPEKSIMGNEYYMHIRAVHEATHALNNEWWTRVGNTKAFEPAIEQHINQLQTTCDNIKKWTSYLNSGRMPRSMDYSDDASVGTICSIIGPSAETQAVHEAFRCINEGDMLQDAEHLRNTANIGHPWFSATELASSTTSVLTFDPQYLIDCFNKQDKLEATLVKQYVKATLELSFIHRPELEQILRQNPTTAKAIDFLMAA